MATCLYAGTTILEVGATSTTFPYNSYTQTYAGGYYYTPWYTKSGYWISGSTQSSSSGFPSTQTVKSGNWLATSKGGTANVKAEVGECYTVNVSAGSGGRVSGGGTVISGGTVSISATANAHYKFLKWNDGSETASRTVTVTSDKTYTASFVQNEWRLYANSEDTNKGTVSRTSWSNGVWVEQGKTKKATANPKPGYKFVGWFKNSDTMPTYITAEAYLAMGTSDTTYTAKFAGTDFTLTVSASPSSGGSVSGTYGIGSRTVTEGTGVNLTADAYWNYLFSGWSGHVNSSAPYISFNMPSADASVHASFTERSKYILNVSAENIGYGSISVKCNADNDTKLTAPGSIHAYTNINYTVTATVADPNLYEFLGWYEYGSNTPLSGGNLSLMLNRIDTSTYDITAKFVQKAAYQIILHPSDGSVDWNPNNDAVKGGCGLALNRTKDFSNPDRWLSGSITATATLGDGWRVQEWGILNNDGGEGSQQITAEQLANAGKNPNELIFALSFNTTLTCVFVRKKYTCSATVDAPSADARAGEAYLLIGSDDWPYAEIIHNSPVTFKAVPASGFGFGGWFRNGSPYPAEGQNTGTEITVEHVTEAIALTAKFTATVKVVAALSSAADGTGKVEIWHNGANVSEGGASWVTENNISSGVDVDAGSDTEYPSSNLIDGDYGTVWRSAPATSTISEDNTYSGNINIVLSFAGVYKLVSLTLTMYSNNPAEYCFYYSESETGDDWATMFEGTVFTEYNNPHGIRRTEERGLTSYNYKAKRLKMQITKWYGTADASYLQLGGIDVSARSLQAEPASISGIVVGDTCTIKAISTDLVESPPSGSRFSSWYNTEDPLQLEDPLSHPAVYTFAVSGNVDLTAYFVGFADIAERYLMVRNYNNNDEIFDPSIGILSASGGEEIEEEDWIDFFYQPPEGGGGHNPLAPMIGEPGVRYYRFSGTVASKLTAGPGASLGFMEWRRNHLVSVNPSAANDYARWEMSTPADNMGKSTTLDVSTNRHYVFTAVWGAPTPVLVKVKLAYGSEENYGSVYMSPETEARDGLPGGGISDKFVQGTKITLSVSVNNGYLFAGWFYDGACLHPVSDDPTPVFEHTVQVATEFFAKFVQDSTAIYKWEGGGANKLLSWRSKRFVAARPLNLSSARAYADRYPLTLRVFTASSPDAPSGVPASELRINEQGARRLPVSRPEKYIELEVDAQGDVTEVAASTSMGGLNA